MGIKIHETIIPLIFLYIFCNMDAKSMPVNTATYFPLDDDIGSKSVEFVNIIKKDLRHNNDDYADKGLYNISNPYLHTTRTTATHADRDRNINTETKIDYRKFYNKEAHDIKNNLTKYFKRRAYSLDSEGARKRGKVLYPRDEGKRGQLLDSQDTGKAGKIFNSQKAENRGNLLDSLDAGKAGKIFNSQKADNRGNLLDSLNEGKRGKKSYPQDTGKNEQLPNLQDVGKPAKILCPQDTGPLLDSQGAGKRRKVLDSQGSGKRGKAFNYTVKDNKFELIEPIASTARISKRFLKVTTEPQVENDQPKYQKFTNQYTQYIERNKAEKLLQFIDQKNSLLDKLISRNKIGRQTVAMTPSEALAEGVVVNDAMAYPVLRAMPRDVVRKLPSPDQLDMAHAKGPRIHAMRIKGRLCHRSVLHPEGPKYDSKGNVYQSGFVPRSHGGRRRDFDNTRSPPLLLPRCCNCCKKSVLGCE